MSLNSNSMRILHIGKYFPPHPGGMEVFLADLVAAQRAAGDESFALVHGDARPEDPEWLMRVPVAMQLVYTPIAPAFRAGLARSIRQFEPDVLHLHMPNPSVFWALTLGCTREIPWIVHWHSDVLATRRFSMLSAAYRVYRPFEQAVLERAERIIVTSPDYLAASAPLRAWRDKCAVVPLALDRRRLVEPVSASAESYWPAGTLRLLSLGRLSHYKGFETLIDAVADLEGVHLVIAGDGEMRSALQARIAAQGRSARASLAGQVDDDTKRALLAQCDAFCLASCERTEAFGIAVMEAMCYARPCIVSALPGSGLPWLVSSSQAGLTVPVGHVPAWREAIQRLRADPVRAAAMGANGSAAIRERFDITPATSAVRAVYPREDIAPVRVTDQPLIVIPARDEAATIAAVIAAIRAQGFDHILVVDDQSKDDTASIAVAAGARVLRPVLPMGAWGAMQTGIRHAMRTGYERVVTMDADGQHEPACIAALLAAASQHDVVIGAFPERGSAARQIAWRYFRLITGFRVEDLTSGFRCYSRAACVVLCDDEATLLDYQDMGVLLLLRRARMRMIEVPVDMYPRASGPSRIFASWSRVARYMLESSLLCLAQWHPRNHFRR